MQVFSFATTSTSFVGSLHCRFFRPNRPNSRERKISFTPNMKIAKEPDRAAFSRAEGDDNASCLTDIVFY